MSAGKNNSTLMMIYIAVLTAMLVIRDLAGVNINKFLFVAVIIGFVAIANGNVIPPMISFLFPLLWGLPYTWFAAPVIVIYLLKRRRIQLKALALFSLFVAAELFASFWYPRLDIIDLIKYFSILLTFFVLLYDSWVDYQNCIYAFVCGLFVLCIVITINTLMNAPSNWLALFVKGWFRFGQLAVEEESDLILQVNANTLAYYSLTGISLCMVGIYKLSGRKKTAAAVLTVFFAVVGILTVSRSCMLVAVLCIVIYILGSGKSLKSTIQTIIIGLVMVLIGYIIILTVPELMEGFQTRWQSSNVATGNGRLDLLIEYHAIFMSDIRFILTGTGVTQYKEITGEYHSIHNMIQQLYSSYGIVGAFVFAYGMLSPLKYVAKKQSIINWIPFISVLTFTQTIQFINPSALMLPYIIAVYVLKTGEKNEEIYNNS